MSRRNPSTRRHTSPTGPVNRRYALQLCGARRGRRYVVAIDRKPFALTAAEFETLCLLACRCLEGPDLWIGLPATAIGRLRSRLREGQARGDLGRELIETLGDGDYRLRADRVRIGRSAGFADIPSPGFLSPAVKAAVLARCPVW